MPEGAICEKMVVLLIHLGDGSLVCQKMHASIDYCTLHCTTVNKCVDFLMQINQGSTKDSYGLVMTINQSSHGFSSYEKLWQGSKSLNNML